MSLKILEKKSVIKNSIKSKNNIQVSFFKGQIDSNIVETTPTVVCAIEGLDFTCENNSQYIPAI